MPRHSLVTSSRVSSSSTTSVFKRLHGLTDPSIPCDQRLWKNPNAERAMSEVAAPKRLSAGDSFDTSPSVERWTQQMTISVIRHPAGARQVTVMNQAGALGFALGIDVKDDSHCFSPVSALSRRVKQAEVGHEMPLVIGRNPRAYGWAIVEGRCGHGGSQAREAVRGNPGHRMVTAQWIGGDARSASRQPFRAATKAAAAAIEA